MNGSMLSATASMRNIQQRLDVTANNVANFNTAGYKSQHASFSDVLTSARNQQEDFRLEGRKTPLGLTEGWGAKMTRLQIDMSQGTLYESGSELDVALVGPMLLEVSQLRRNNEGQILNDPAGNPLLDRVWTRNASFHLSAIAGDNERMYLATPQGRPLLGANNQPLVVPNGYKVSIDENGNVSAVNPNNPNETPMAIGQLKLVRILQPQMLQSIGEQQYKVEGDDEAQIAQALQIVNLNVRNADTQALAIRQGYQEQSNVSLSDEMTSLIALQRSLQFTSKALQSADTLMDLTNNIRR